MPKVQVERELSPILEIFLEGFMNNLAQKGIIDAGNYQFIAPEFPLTNGEDNGRSINIDYLMLNNKTLYLIELKTDSGSFTHKQYNEYKNVIKDNTPQELYDFLSKLAEKQPKYKYLKEYIDKNIEKSNINNFSDIEKIKLLYIAPKRILDRKWGKGNSDAVAELNKKQLITFDDLHMFNQIDHEFSAEWEIITSHLVRLDNKE